MSKLRIGVVKVISLDDTRELMSLKNKFSKFESVK